MDLFQRTLCGIRENKEFIKKYKNHYIKPLITLGGYGKMGL
jgi:hypothetical protein